MQRITDNLWLLRYPQSLLGTQIDRTVSAIRLNSGELVVHSRLSSTPSSRFWIGILTASSLATATSSRRAAKRTFDER
jgi:hypothetical protein